MDPTETIARAHLEHIGFTNIEFEPDGNVPPDFVVDGRIAVEVRRLNQHVERRGAFQGLEEVDIPLAQRMRSLMDRMGAPRHGVSWFVFYRFGRPLEKWKTLSPRIEDWFEVVRDTPGGGRRDQSFGQFSVTLVARSTPTDKAFILGGYSDEDSGGWLLELIARNAAICVDEKTHKIASRRSKYPEWWLLLVDHIGYALSDFERELIREHPPLQHSWNKVRLVNPLDPTRSFDL